MFALDDKTTQTQALIDLPAFYKRDVNGKEAIEAICNYNTLQEPTFNKIKYLQILLYFRRVFPRPVPQKESLSIK